MLLIVQQKRIVPIPNAMRDAVPITYGMFHMEEVNRHFVAALLAKTLGLTLSEERYHQIPVRVCKGLSLLRQGEALGLACKISVL